MYARATTLRVSPEQVQEAIVHYQAGIPSCREIAGNQGAFLLVDRSAGKGIGVTLWDSEESMRASREGVDELQQQPAQEVTEPRPASVDEYEVALWVVS